MTTYFEDIREGDIFRGAEVIVDKVEMLAYARRNDPQPLHVDEELAKHFPYGCERQRPRTSPPERDVLHEQIAGWPSRADAIVRNDAKRQKDSEEK
jgi:hypothetical protein